MKINVSLFVFYGPRILQYEIGGELQTSGSAFHCRRRQTCGVLLWHTSADIKVSPPGVVLLSPSTSEFQGPETREGKLFRQQQPSSLQICLPGKQIPCPHTDTMEKFKKEEMIVFPSLWQAARKCIHCRVKFLKATRTKTISFKTID